MDKTISESNWNLFRIQLNFLSKQIQITLGRKKNYSRKEIQVILKSLFRHIFPNKKTS